MKKILMSAAILAMTAIAAVAQTGYDAFQAKYGR